MDDGFFSICYRSVSLSSKLWDKSESFSVGTYSGKHWTRLERAP